MWGDTTKSIIDGIKKLPCLFKKKKKKNWFPLLHSYWQKDEWKILRYFSWWKRISSGHSSVQVILLTALHGAVCSQKKKKIPLQILFSVEAPLGGTVQIFVKYEKMILKTGCICAKLLHFKASYKSAYLYLHTGLWYIFSRFFMLLTAVIVNLHCCYGFLWTRLYGGTSCSQNFVREPDLPEVTVLFLFHH